MELDLEPVHGKLIRRYKRFLADIELDPQAMATLALDEPVTTIHCPNTGSMKGCAIPGSDVYFSRASNPKRKYPYTWELARNPEGEWICVNTARPNALVGEAIAGGVITELDGYAANRAEVRYGENSRADWFLSGHANAPDCYVEVKNVTLLEDGQGYFPDAVSARASKHLEELRAMVKAGYRAMLVYVVNHTGIHSVRAAAHIDPAYAEALQEARRAGVEVVAYATEISPASIRIVRPVPVRF